MTTSAPATSALELVGRRPGGAVVDDDPQAGREPRRLGRPVADHGGRGDDQRRARRPAVRGEVGQHRRRLAQAHVEGQAAAEPDRVEEAEPGQRLGLVAAQLADEALGAGDRLRRDARGPCRSRSVAQPLPSTREAAGQRGALQADGVAQDLGAGELRRGRPARPARRPPP